jgi:hypothetical protein
VRDLQAIKAYAAVEELPADLKELSRPPRDEARVLARTA